MIEAIGQRALYLPDRYPPAAAAISCVSVIHKMPVKPNEMVLIPSFLQGEIEDNPRPAPRISNMSDNAAAAVAPAYTAPQ